MQTTTKLTPTHSGIRLAILVAALGYFVDMYDLILFGIVRQDSLRSLGLSGDALTTEGIFLLDMQMTGMLVGGIIWGILGDRMGRLTVLFGSILLYSLANLANGFVQSLDAYAVLRLLAGLGLAGELGAGITLVSELMSARGRGYGTTLIAAVGLLGAAVAGLVAGHNWQLGIENWRVAYFVGAGLGLLLLALRVSVRESTLFSQMKEVKVQRGNFLLLFQSRKRFTTYLSCILVGLPIWYMVGILVFFSAEFGNELGVTGLIRVPTAVMVCYFGCSLGDLFSGLLSQLLHSRRKAVGVFLLLCVAITVYTLTRQGISLAQLYTLCFFLGFFAGYWAVFVTIASEQFGTNLRATATTTVPNFVRGAVVPITLSFQALRAQHSNVYAAWWVGGVCFLLAFIALATLKETYGRALDYYEN